MTQQTSTSTQLGLLEVRSQFIISEHSMTLSPVLYLSSSLALMGFYCDVLSEIVVLFYTQALQNFGASHVLNTYLTGLSQQADCGTSPEIQEFQYEAALRSCNWALESPNSVSSKSSYSQAVYTGVCALKDRDQTLTSSSLNVARLVNFIPYSLPTV